MSLQVIPSHPSIPPRLPSVIFFAWTIQEPQTPPLAATITFLLCYGQCLFSVLRISPHSSAWHKGFLKSICLSHFLSFFQSRSLSHKFNQVLQCTALCVCHPLPGKLFLLLSPPHPTPVRVCLTSLDHRPTPTLPSLVLPADQRGSLAPSQ